MAIEEYRGKINPCYGRSCYHADFGCMFPSAGRLYVCCPFEREEKKTDKTDYDENESPNAAGGDRYGQKSGH